MKIGDKVSLKKIFDHDEVSQYLDVVKDRNLLNFGAYYEKSTQPRSDIVPSLLVSTLFSNIIASQLPGPGSIYLSMTLNFQETVLIGEEVTAKVEIKDIKKEKIFILRIKSSNQDNKTIVDGETAVLYDSKYIIGD